MSYQASITRGQPCTLLVQLFSFLSEFNYSQPVVFKWEGRERAGVDLVLLKNDNLGSFIMMKPERLFSFLFQASLSTPSVKPSRVLHFFLLLLTISAVWSQDFLSKRRANQVIGDMEDMDPPPASWSTFPERQTHWIRDLIKRQMASSQNICLSDNQRYDNDVGNCMDVSKKI